MNDPTECIRRQRLFEINARPGNRVELEAQYGQVWNTVELSRDFEVIGFLAPWVAVRRLSDGHLGTLEFQHCERLYFNFQPDVDGAEPDPTGSGPTFDDRVSLRTAAVDQKKETL